ncbi:unnamed protein product [Peniophora sp. CBMAI 1063]|nr:unnamed protein product [Peniophora sp. CBMAI 1063]
MATLATSLRRAPPRLARHLATEASTASAESSSSPASAPARRRKAGASEGKPQLRTAVILNRTPILTRTPTPFENAFYKYQQRIQRTFHNPFPYDFYFKPGSILESRFILEEREREREAFFPGFGADSKWAPTPKVSEEDLKKFGSEEDKAMKGRRGESDEKGDVRSLDRAGERNLYLVLRKSVGGKEAWRFPEGAVEGEEFLHESAERNLREECGENMDTWVVSLNPIGLVAPPADAPSAPKTNLFFYKAHIMAGQARPSDASDFAWLTKQEIEARLKEDAAYWDSVKDMLSDF